MPNILGREFDVTAKSIYETLFTNRYADYLVLHSDSTLAAPKTLPFSINLDKYMQARKGRNFNGSVSMIGCHGIAACFTKKQFQKASVVVQNNVGRNAATAGADFNFLLGDNFYDDGISKANITDQFQQSFIEPYAKNKLNCFCVLGNHDYYTHSLTRWGHHSKFAIALHPLKYYNSTPQKTLERGLRQVALTYLPPKDACHRERIGRLARTTSSTAKTNIERASRIAHIPPRRYTDDRDPAKKWNMPYRYYSLLSEVADFIVLDSNSFLFDKAQQKWLKETLHHIRPPVVAGGGGGGGAATAHLTNKEKRAMWAEMAIANARKPLILVMHHPFYCAGKRAGKLDDYEPYAKAFGVNPKEFKDYYRELLDMDKSGEIGAMIFQWMKQHHIYFDYLLCAHDHVLTVDRLPQTENPDTQQLISGGGGGPLGNSTKNTDKITEFRRVHFPVGSGIIRDKGTSRDNICHTQDLRLEYGYHHVDFSTGCIKVHDQFGQLKYTNRRAGRIAEARRPSRIAAPAPRTRTVRPTMATITEEV